MVNVVQQYINCLERNINEIEELEEIENLVNDWGIVEFACTFISLVINNDRPHLLCLREMLLLERKYEASWDREYNNLFKIIKKPEKLENECSWERIDAPQNSDMKSWMMQSLFYFTLFKSIKTKQKIENTLIAYFSTLSKL
jgi:hypothetical protein